MGLWLRSGTASSFSPANERRHPTMKESNNAKSAAAAVLAAAAIGGILAGQATATTADKSVHGPTTLADKKPAAESKPKAEPEGKAAPTKKAKYSHLCTGKNTCKG